MLDLRDIVGYEFMRPMVTGWLSKVESALTCQARRKWKDLADEALMFYGRSAAAMWDPVYSKKFWRGVKPPRFRVTINKAFEFVAVYGPNLMWDIPHRTATAKKALKIPEGLFPDPQVYQFLMQQVAQERSKDQIVASLAENWLNYTPRETNLEGQNERAVLDAMLKGSGHMWPYPKSFPGSERTLTCCQHRPPEDLIIDPDFKVIEEAQWVCLKHTDPHWKVEKRFKLPAGSLKNKSSLESSWHYSEMMSQEGQGVGDRRSGKTNDLVIWYEIWSKMGAGARMTGMESTLKNHLEEIVGDYAYICICPDCPYPLNCPADKIRNGASDAEIKQHFEWPVPWWKDNRWPVDRLIFYEDPESPYGLPPLAPAMGELKAMNAIVSWLVNRTWQSSKQMYAVLGQYHDDLKKQLEEGEDLSVFGIPPTGGDASDIKKMIQILETPEVSNDSWQVLELLSNNFDKRMGMTPFVYGQNEDGTQDRTASTTEARKSAVSARPEYMQKKVVAWQGRLAAMEALLAWLFVKAPDVAPSMGNVGAMLWAQYVENADPELIMRETHYEVAASSIRRPNRERDITNLQELGDRYFPVAQKYGELTGDYTPANGYLSKWADLHDTDMEKLYFPAKDPNSPEAQLQSQMRQAELQKVQAEGAKLNAEAQVNPQEEAMAEMQLEMQKAQQEAQIEAAMAQQKMQLEKEKAQMDMTLKLKELEMKAAEAKQQMAIDVQKNQADTAMKMQEMQANMAMQKQQSQFDMEKSKLETDSKLKSESKKWEAESTKKLSEMQLKSHESAIQMALKQMEAKANIELEKKRADGERQDKEREAKSAKAEQDKQLNMKELASVLVQAIKSQPAPVVNVQGGGGGKRKIKVKRDKDGRLEGLESE